MTADLTNPVFQDEAKAREWLEASRWPNGPVCPHCGTVGERIAKLEGKAHRPGLYECYECHSQFSVTVGTLYERSHIPLHKWLLATHLMTASKKGISAHQLHRMLGITYKSAWFMAHRIREAMGSKHATPMGSGGTVEVDETFIGRKRGSDVRRGAGHKMVVMSLVERGGTVRSFQIDGLTMRDLEPVVYTHVAPDAKLMTDDAAHYDVIGRKFKSHESVNHTNKEYVRGKAHTNTIEGYFSIFKRGMKGVYQHCSEQHLHRYLAEFDFRYSNRTALGVSDAERAEKALKGIVGKRLTYRRTNQRIASA